MAQLHSASMHSDDSTNGEFDTPTTAPENETHDDSFAAELRDLELRLEQLELEQRSLRIQIQRARLRRVEHNTGTPSSPPTTRSRPQQPSVRGPLTPGRTPCHPGACDERPSSTLSATPLPDRLTSQGIPQQGPWRTVSHEQVIVWTPLDTYSALATR